MKRFLLKLGAVTLALYLMLICKDVWGFETVILVVAALFLGDDLLKKIDLE